MIIIKTKKNLKFIGVIITTIIIVFSLSFVRISLEKRKNEIDISELTTFGEKNENVVMMYFSDKYNINSFGKHFWNQSFEEENPTDELYQRSLSDVIKHRSINKFAEDLGIEKNISFSDEKKLWSEQNSGLAFWQYLESKDNETIDKIKGKLVEIERPRDKELKQSFEDLEDKYKKTEYSVSAIEIPSYNGNIDDLQSVAQRIPKNCEVEEIVDIWEKEFPSMLINSLQIESSNIQKEDIYSISIGEILSEQEVGSIVEGYHDNQYFYLFEKKGGELLDFDEAPKFALNAYINNVFEERLLKYEEDQEFKLKEQNKKEFIQYYKNI